MNRRLELSVIALAAVSACGAEPLRPRSAPPPTRSVRAERVHLDESAAGEAAIGTVRARNTAAISTTVVGKVRELNVTLGRRVRPGEVLARISADELSAKLDQTEAMYGRSQVEFERAKNLIEHAAIPRAQYDAAAAEFQLATARRAEAGAMAEHTVLRAPFAGVVSAKLANVGDTAMPGQTLLVLEDPRSLRLEATVPAIAAPLLRTGQSVPVLIEGAERPLAGTVAEISPGADPMSRTVLAKIDLPPEPSLRSGLVGRLLLPASPGQAGTMVVPPGTVIRRGQLEELFVADQGRARLRLVKTGRIQPDGATEILSGLAPGEVVITSDLAELVDGQPVEARL